MELSECTPPICEPSAEALRSAQSALELLDRRRNLNDDELLVFCKAVQNRYDGLFGRLKSSNPVKKKEEEWFNVALDCASNGCSAFLGRTVKQLRDDLYAKKKKKVLDKLEASRTAERGTVKFKPYEQVIISTLLQPSRLEICVAPHDYSAATPPADRADDKVGLTPLSSLIAEFADGPSDVKPTKPTEDNNATDPATEDCRSPSASSAESGQRAARKRKFPAPATDNVGPPASDAQPPEKDSTPQFELDKQRLEVDILMEELRGRRLDNELKRLQILEVKRRLARKPPRKI